MASQHDTRIPEAIARKYWREADARHVVDAWRESGLSMAEFARLHGVHAKRLSRWAERLQTTPADSVTFVPVKLTHQPIHEVAAQRIEVVLTSGCVIRLPAAFAARDLRQVLDVLEGRP